MKVSCPNCDAKLSVHPKSEGRRVKCPRCSKNFKIPHAIIAAPTGDPLTLLFDESTDDGIDEWLAQHDATARQLDQGRFGSDSDRLEATSLALDLVKTYPHDVIPYVRASVLLREAGRLEHAKAVLSEGMHKARARRHMYEQMAEVEIAKENFGDAAAWLLNAYLAAKKVGCPPSNQVVLYLKFLGEQLGCAPIASLPCSTCFSSDYLQRLQRLFATCSRENAAKIGEWLKRLNPQVEELPRCPQCGRPVEPSNASTLPCFHCEIMFDNPNGPVETPQVSQSAEASGDSRSTIPEVASELPESSPELTEIKTKRREYLVRELKHEFELLSHNLRKVEILYEGLFPYIQLEAYSFCLWAVCNAAPECDSATKRELFKAYREELESCSYEGTFNPASKHFSECEKRGAIVVKGGVTPFGYQAGRLFQDYLSAVKEKQRAGHWIEEESLREYERAFWLELATLATPEKQNTLAEFLLARAGCHKAESRRLAEYINFQCVWDVERRVMADWPQEETPESRKPPVANKPIGALRGTTTGKNTRRTRRSSGFDVVDLMVKAIFAVTILILLFFLAGATCGFARVFFNQ